MLESAVAREDSSTRGKVWCTVSLRAACAALLAGSALSALPGVSAATIAQRTTTTTITLPAALEATSDNFCTWGFCTNFSPRLYQAPMADGRTLIGWTDATGNGHVSRVNGATIEQTFDFSATWLRGLVVHPDNSFAVLLEVNPTAAPPTAIFQRIMEIQLLTATGTVQWTTQLPNTAMIGLTAGAAPDSNEIGDSRLTYGNGQYAAYFAIRAEPDATNTEHNLDQLSFVSDAGVFSTTTGWGFGVSHSLAELVDFQPTLQTITAVAVSDCYPPVPTTDGSNPPQPGLYADHTNLLMTDAGNCGGSTAVQLGQMAAISGGSWLVAFSGQTEPAESDFGFPQAPYTGKGIGVLSFNAATYAPSAVTWLTNTDGTDERDPVLARIGTSVSSNRFLTGWRLQNEGTFNMEVIDPNGNVLNPLETVSPTTGWGNRDDSLKPHPDGSITWLQGAGGATTLQMYRYYEVPPARDFAGTRTSDILWRNSTTNDAVIWLMKNGALTSSTDLGVVDASWSIAGSGDFNGDGTNDILWRNTNGDVVIWFINNGKLSSSADLGIVAPVWSIVGAGDFNHDGTTDILWRNTSTGDVVVWFIQNGKISSSTDLGVIPTTWTVAATGDFNGDGTTDILWRDSNTKRTVVWFIKAGAISSSSDLGVVDPAMWTVAGTGDFNGDGKSDILWRNTSGQAVIWFSNGTSVTSSQDLGVVPTAWTVAGTGDYNGDGTTDILWRNTATGDTVTWMLQNGTLSTSADLGIVPDAWAITSPAVQ